MTNPHKASDHPQRGKAGTGNHANMVADGKGGWQTVAQQRKEDAELARQLHDYQREQGHRPVKDEEPPEE